MCESQMGFRPRKVLVAGDSAGGNLTAAITVKAIEDGFKVPDGILLIYPVVDMRRVFSPSLMWSVNDRIVPFVFLECCLSAYLGSADEAKVRALDSRCSPALASEAILKHLPPTRIVVGDCDPLMDQSVRFANHLASIGVDVKCKIFQAMPHGFCSFVWPIVGVPEVKTCIDSCTDLLKELAENRDMAIHF
jgi:acetyl esterase/lipase